MDEFDVFGLVDFILISNNKDRFSEESMSAGIKLYDEGIRNPPVSIYYSRDNFAYFERKYYADLFNSVMKLSPDPLLAKEFLSVVVYKAMEQAAFEMSTFEVSSVAYSEIDLDLVEEDDSGEDTATYGTFEELKSNLIGRSIVEWKYSTLTLDDGSELNHETTEPFCYEDSTVGGDFFNVNLNKVITGASDPEISVTLIDCNGQRHSRAQVTLFNNGDPIALVDFHATGFNSNYDNESVSVALNGVHYLVFNCDGFSKEDELNDK